MSFFEEHFEEAADRWIQVLMTDRSLDDDGARKACTALFTLLGDHHPVTDAFRRRFSMALYA
jgi:putative thioredoxin